MGHLLLASLAAVLSASVASAQPAAEPATTAQPAKPAPAAANWTAGAKVRDTSGEAVATISKVEGESVVIRTDKHEVRLPKTSFAPQGDGFVIAMTQAEVNAEVEKTLAGATGNPAAGTEAEASKTSDD